MSVFNASVLLLTMINNRTDTKNWRQLVKFWIYLTVCQVNNYRQTNIMQPPTCVKQPPPIRWPVIEVLMRAFLWFLPLLRGQQPLSGNYPFLGGWLFNRGQNVVIVLSNWSHRNMVRTKKRYTSWYKCSHVCHCFHHILSCLVWSFYWTGAWQHGIYSVD